MDRRIPLVLPSHTTAGECHAEPSISAASDIGRLMAESLTTTGASSALLRSKMYYMSPRDRNERSGVEGPGWGSLVCYCTSYPCKLSRTVQFHAASQAAAGEGELDYVNY